VQELLQEWVSQITSAETLDHLVRVIMKRKKDLHLLSDKEKIARLIATYKDIEYGEVLWLKEPYGIPPAALDPKRRRKYQRVKFYSYQPRKKLLWVTLPWLPADKRTVPMRMRDIERYQPSRTEPEIRR